MPEVLSRIYDENKSRFLNTVDDETSMLKAFEVRKLDNNYCRMVEEKKKEQNNKMEK